jgi:4-amino-4-deoxy-L-arabinose transferase-like glycosyltransferase
VVIYFIGRNFLNDHIGLCGAAIFSLNPYTSQLVHGKEFSGFSDLAFAFFVSVALYLILEWTQNRSTATLRLLGLVLGLGYMCKGGLAFAPFAVLVGVAILTGRIRDLIPALLQSIIVFGVVVLPERLYWLAHHPVECRYEQQRQLLHLFTSIEEWGAPWHAYFTQYLPSMLGAPLVPFAYFSIGWAPFDNSSPNVREPLIQIARNALEMTDLIEDFDNYKTELREFNHSVRPLRTLKQPMASTQADSATAANTFNQAP